MTRAKTNAPQTQHGRGRKRLNLDMVRRLAAIGCSVDEIAESLGCSVDALRHHSATMEDGRAQLRLSLRWWQWKLAESGNVEMLIHLGRQWLGHRDETGTESGDEADATTKGR